MKNQARKAHDWGGAWGLLTIMVLAAFFAVVIVLPG